MSKQNYPKLSLVDFGVELVTTGDLDPVYLALNKVDWHINKKLRWLTAYCAFYSCAVATYISTYKSNHFWEVMQIVAVNAQLSPIGSRWSRSPERRHFRGKQAVLAIDSWRSRFCEPEDLFKYVLGKRKGQTFEAISNRALELRSVGNWLSFKMVDLVDACLGAEVNQTDVTPFLYKTPKESLERYFVEDLKGNLADTNWSRKALDDLTKLWKGLSIPHKPGKPLDMFCKETILCKHLSHLHGHYPLGNDIHKIHQELISWFDVKSPLNKFIQEFAVALPPE